MNNLIPAAGDVDNITEEDNKPLINQGPYVASTRLLQRRLTLYHNTLLHLQTERSHMKKDIQNLQSLVLQLIYLLEHHSRKKVDLNERLQIVAIHDIQTTELLTAHKEEEEELLEAMHSDLPFIYF